jgi:hypothetical protein
MDRPGPPAGRASRARGACGSGRPISISAAGATVQPAAIDTVDVRDDARGQERDRSAVADAAAEGAEAVVAALTRSSSADASALADQVISESVTELDRALNAGQRAVRA